MTDETTEEPIYCEWCSNPTTEESRIGCKANHCPFANSANGATRDARLQWRAES